MLTMLAMSRRGGEEERALLSSPSILPEAPRGQRGGAGCRGQCREGLEGRPCPVGRAQGLEERWDEEEREARSEAGVSAGATRCCFVRRGARLLLRLFLLVAGAWYVCRCEMMDANKWLWKP
jgi:hypothetical protein